MYRRPSCHVAPRRFWRTAAAPRALSRASADAREEIGRAGRAMRPPLAQALRCWSGAARRGEGCSGDTLVGDDGARGAPLLAGRCALSAASCARPCVALGATSRGAAVQFSCGAAAGRPPLRRVSGDVVTAGLIYSRVWFGPVPGSP
ncbi:hypothetical protein F511_45082 [Dorcoceras hygrometricum]|uniref:Uncharacterized protein n=1 Tax=Dorcoceras hygrometricum TaxID=472368 RepID=A0A2Z7A4N8_9LAMI|nr:hypothetical protein F511_45082 [Dorcoceras hygrometricum]